MKPLKFAKITATTLSCALALVVALPARCGQNASASGEQLANQTEKKSAQHSAQDIANAKAQGLVWVNTSKRVYYKTGSKYGKTKYGKFMSEDSAREQGYQEAKEPANTSPAPHKKDQSGLDGTIETHSSMPPKQ